MTEQENTGKSRSCRTHRVGTITAGLMLVVFGMLFLLHMFLDTVTYTMIFRLWPVILISLGVEILLSQVQKNKTLVYDRGAVFVMICMMIFSMIMGFAATAMDYHNLWYL